MTEHLTPPSVAVELIADELQRVNPGESREYAIECARTILVTDYVRFGLADEVPPGWRRYISSDLAKQLDLLEVIGDDYPDETIDIVPPPVVEGF